MTGLFAHRGHNQGRAFAVWRAQQAQARAAERRQLLDRFAGYLAEDEGTVAYCASRMGKTVGWGEAALREIRKGLGRPAV